MNYLKVSKFDTANGPGIGTVLWVSGCLHHCKGCHNPETWNPSAGQKYTSETTDLILESLAPDYISRLTISGGDPLYFSNVIPLSVLLQYVKEVYPDIKIWLYTGHIYEDIQREISLGNVELECLLHYVDVLVDGRYEEDKKDISLPYCGSSNQRVIDMNLSTPDSIVLYKRSI